ncbi:MAG: dihydrofolate reductase family protein [Alphaproteobacteria bacterium]|nr:dihydrofolate reductase family protein [Alphaproteobacteria bacterium]
MRRVRYSVAMSLDGFIAGPKGENDWIVMDPEIDFRALMSSFDTILMGRKTYEASRGHGGGGMPGINAYVFSRTLRQKDCPSVTVTANARETIGEIKAQAGKDLWLFGGGGLFRSLLEQGLVDAVDVTVVPVLLGGGVKLLPEPYDVHKLKLMKHRVYEKTGTVSLEYAVAS